MSNLKANINTRSNVNFNLNISQGDGYVIIRGQTEDGFVDVPVELDSDNAENRIRGLVEKISSHQLSEIQKFAEEAESNYREQLEDFITKLDEYYDDKREQEDTD